jgi:hypothetical protein
VAAQVVELQGVNRLVRLCKEERERNHSDGVLVACLVCLLHFPIWVHWNNAIFSSCMLEEKLHLTYNIIMINREHQSRFLLCHRHSYVLIRNACNHLFPDRLQKNSKTLNCLYTFQVISHTSIITDWLNQHVMRYLQEGGQLYLQIQCVENLKMHILNET